MPQKYSFFKDPRALAEIRKHKWIESQKAGTEIGFASAAVDWVQKYGKQWKEIHIKEGKDTSAFIERRRFRRFKINGCVELIKADMLCLAEFVDMSLFGLLCRTNDFLRKGSEIQVKLLLASGKSKTLVCSGMIERVVQAPAQKYELYIEFDENSRRQIENINL